MIETRAKIMVIDNFCPLIDKVRQSALQSGFGKWTPNKGYIGSSIYEGMNFWGAHSHMLASVSMAMEAPIYPNSMFFRVTTPEMEPAYIHSDRESGAYTCVAYLSEHPGAGTAFYRHLESKLEEMPSFKDIEAMGLVSLVDDMVSAEGFEQTDFVPAKYNRAVIFHAPLFHSRIPRTGLGVDEETGRMVWVSHFHTPHSLMENEHG